ncbi:uncharacterized protein LOC142532481 [Primulina tabacum]|uniref:uncharacterized protein LOC142532481 n=1 Tax=Primulina tabacum TaxID=48773 RepID=UPI003F5A294C
MALVRTFGKPDLFITMTCNPEWKEIKDNLKEGQKAQDRPDLTSRVFRAKLHDLKTQIIKKEIFGKVAAYVYVIEFQKRGLPHVHMLVILKPAYKINTPDQFDYYVSAELPNKDTHPRLHDLVVKHMIHGPCGDMNKKNSCMVNGQCKSHYPRLFCQTTTQGKDGYPIYRRRNNGQIIDVRRTKLNTQWVVPHNSYLLLRYDCHINVEVCSGLTAVKYLYKYIYKGHDKVAVHIAHEDGENVIDEIKNFQDARWVSAQEAVWRIFEFDLNEISPAVINLPLHFPNKQCVTFWKNQSLRNVLQWEHVSKTMLTEFFQMCATNDRAKALLYSEFIEYYVWDKKNKFWQQRKKGKVIGRVNGANPVEEAAQRRGLLESDKSIFECLNEAVSFQMPHALRRLFATILIGPSEVIPREILDELAVNIPYEDYLAQSNLNTAQRKAFSTIIDCLDANKNGLFFVDGPGGTGKTYLYRALLANVRSRKMIALATATSGVAASILPGGRTAHSRFKIPIDLHDKSYCTISKQSGLAELCRRTHLIIWDEAPMAKRLAIEAVDRSLRDLTGIQKPFGGKVVVLGGDFMQVLPVVPKASIQETINASLVKSYLYEQISHLTLSENMRARSDPLFSDFLLRVGNGTECSDADGNIKIPDDMIIKYDDDYDDEDSSEQKLIDHIFPNIEKNFQSADYMTNRAILASKNEYVDKLNDKIIQSFPCETRTFTSLDEAVDDTQNFYPSEFLNSLTPNGMPPHRLVLKKNCTIMLLRNLDPSDGLCNGTRMVCRGFQDNVIHAEITVGHPRIPLSPAENEGYPFQFRRKQFPIRLCFAMKINKAQGQTIPFVGVYLPQPVFSHGQLYVALSRGTSMANTKVLIKPSTNTSIGDTWTRNVVYHQVLARETKDIYQDHVSS